MESLHCDLFVFSLTVLSSSSSELKGYFNRLLTCDTRPLLNILSTFFFQGRFHMGFINRKAEGSVRHRRAIKEHEEHKAENAHATWMGGPSYAIGNPIYNLRLAASSCFFGEPMYYHTDKSDPRPKRCTPNSISVLSDSDRSRLRETLNAVDPQEWRAHSPAELMSSAIDKALDHDIEMTLQEAVRLRNEENIRTTPQVIMVRAAHHRSAKGTGLIRKYADQIIRRPDEPAVQLAYQINEYGRKKIPNSLKRAWRDRLEAYTEFNLAKYRMENRQVKTVDVMNLTHPKSDNIDKLANGKLTLNQETWEALISKKGPSTNTWTEAVDTMGHMALLRNLRNLVKHAVPHSKYTAKLVEGAATGKQFPFRYLSAYKAIQDDAPGPVLDAVEESLEHSLKNLPHFGGRVMSLCDNSGSAHGAMTSSMGTMSIAEIANLTGVLTGRVSDEGHIGVFGDRLKTSQIRRKASIFDQAIQANKDGKRIGAATENGIWLFWDQAIRKKEHWDHVFVYSDMQAGHGGLYGTNPRDYSNYVWSGKNGTYIDVPKLIIDYRNKVNPNVMVYCVQVAGYQDTIIPEFYDKTYILGGWSDGILRFAAQMSQLHQQGQ